MAVSDQINEVLNALGPGATADEIAYATRGYSKRDLAAVFAHRALTGQVVGSIANPVAEAVVNIIASPAQPIPLFITGPPIGMEEDYFASIVTGDPDYTPIFLISKYGGLTVSPSDATETPLTLESLATDDTTVLHLSSGDGELLRLGANGALNVYQPGVGTSLVITSAGEVSLGVEGGSFAAYGGQPAAKPEVPASPTAQDVVDALVALNWISQAE